MQSSKVDFGLWSIVLMGLILRVIAIFLDPFLHPWDERFHALVARNMMENPFVPILRVNPITENYDPFAWCCNHIWLHKQPLFMWQMALSMKVFGVSEWAMRLPSAIMGTLLILLLYRTAFLLTQRKTVALLSALMMATSNYHLQLISGIKGMDHNDVAHGFYVVASIWAWCEYRHHRCTYWVILIGFFAGAAVLNKWLTGLLVYLIWGIAIFSDSIDGLASRKEVLYFAISFLVCLAVFLPWQIYIFHRFPEIAKHEHNFNLKHIREVVEGHGGNIFYYFKHLGELFGWFLHFLIPVGIWVSVWHRRINFSSNTAIVTALVFVFLFYSIIVRTKITTYLFFIVPLFLIYIGLAIDFLFEKVLKYSMLQVSALFAICCLCLNPKVIAEYLSSPTGEREKRIYNAKIYRNLKSELPSNVKVVMNMNSFEDIDVMFYNEGITAYHWTLSEEDFRNLRDRKIPIAVFEPHGNYQLANYVWEYPYLFIIRKKLESF
ncbi:MAG: glycosyltransferase family 39 protein [Saprospiraceae bacterium]|nr:glycosyltransferase family 39 protein [Saprospiraceae bacterium]MDW8483308.1 glycosyltransferase family 39 protein [Saprospiraceae bacterium]